MWLEASDLPASEEATTDFTALGGETGIHEEPTDVEAPVLMVCEAPPEAFLMAEAPSDVDGNGDIATDPPVPDASGPRLMTFAMPPEGFAESPGEIESASDDTDLTGSAEFMAEEEGFGEPELCAIAGETGLDDTSGNGVEDESQFAGLDGSEEEFWISGEAPQLVDAAFGVTEVTDESEESSDPEIGEEPFVDDAWISKGAPSLVDAAFDETDWSDETDVGGDPEVVQARDLEDGWSEPTDIFDGLDSSDSQDLTGEESDSEEAIYSAEEDDEIALYDDGITDGASEEDDSLGATDAGEDPLNRDPVRVYDDLWPRYYMRGPIPPVTTADGSENSDGSTETDPTLLEQPLEGIDWENGIAYATAGGGATLGSGPDGSDLSGNDQVLMAVPDAVSDGSGDEVPAWTSDTPETPVLTTSAESEDTTSGTSGESEDPIASTQDTPGEDPVLEPTELTTGWDRGSDTPLPWARGGQVEKSTSVPSVTSPVGSPPAAPVEAVTALSEDAGPGWSDGFRAIAASPLSGTPGGARATATGERDWLTGSESGGTRFQWDSHRHSLLGRRGDRTWDVVDGFNGDLDMLEAPDNVVTRSIQTISGHTERVRRSQIRDALDGRDFAANTAAAFTNARFEGTFVVFNDNQAGFQAKHDSIVFLRHYDFAPIDLA